MKWTALLSAAVSVMLTGPIAAAAASSSWSDLWITPEQRAQRALDSGQPLEAARRSRDPKRQAHAYALAGQYARAAKLLEPFHDVDSDYNRGNALARSGQLLAALIAYNAALRRAPDDADVRHNRDLVAQALEQQFPEELHGANTPSSGGAGAQHSQDSDSAASGESRSGAQSGGEKRSGEQTGAPNSGSTAGGGAATPDDEQQAERDAAAGASAQQRAPINAARAAGGSAREAGRPRSGAGELAEATATDLPPGRPQSEQQLALEQWLRRIPDDPGGLLRRKFLIEHIARHQQGEP